MTQRNLFTPPPADPDTLTDRQRRAYELIHAAGRDGITADEIGAALHADRGKHDAGDRCQWCAADARDVLDRLKQLGLAAYKRKTGWVAARYAKTGPLPGDLPEGF